MFFIDEHYIKLIVKIVFCQSNKSLNRTILFSRRNNKGCCVFTVFPNAAKSEYQLLFTGPIA